MRKLSKTQIVTLILIAVTFILLSSCSPETQEEISRQLASPIGEMSQLSFFITIILIVLIFS